MNPVTDSPNLELWMFQLHSGTKCFRTQVSCYSGSTSQSMKWGAQLLDYCWNTMGSSKLFKHDSLVGLGVRHGILDRNSRGGWRLVARISRIREKNHPTGEKYERNATSASEAPTESLVHSTSFESSRLNYISSVVMTRKYSFFWYKRLYIVELILFIG